MRTGRAGIVVVLIVAFLLAGFSRDRARAMRSGPNDIVGGAGASASLANMDSFALALLLGGLRGPLVMFLWTQSENLKNEKNLEDFDTYVEWIRLLQPEFDSVLIFQSWNKAYNISVQMASLSNKYSTIIDAIDFSRRAEAERPNNISMLYQIGSIYGDKLGGSAEKNYYKDQVRKQTRWRAAEKSNELGRRRKLDPMLDASGSILPDLLAAKYPRPANLKPDAEWADGSELQYLAPYQPFKYGLSALALGYDYQKRAQVLQDVSGQVHANLSPMVLDSRPALALKAWSEDEGERGRRLEMKALNVAVAAGDDLKAMQLPTANFAPDAPMTDAAVVPEAIDSYDLAARTARDSVGEFERHLRTYPGNLQNYQSMMDALVAQEELYKGDADYLRAMKATAGEQRKAMLASAAKHYREAMTRNYYVILRWYFPDDLAARVLPSGVKRSDIADKVPHDQYPALYEKAMGLLKFLPYDSDADDRGEYQRYLERAQARLKLIGG
jgi:hypothetical protein